MRQLRLGRYTRRNSWFRVWGFRISGIRDPDPSPCASAQLPSAVNQRAPADLRPFTTMGHEAIGTQNTGA